MNATLEKQKMLMRLRNAAQLTLPAEVRRALNVKEGDYLEARITGEGILLRPVAVVERARAFARIEKAAAKVKDRTPNGPKGIAEEKTIAREVKALRKRRG